MFFLCFSDIHGHTGQQRQFVKNVISFPSHQQSFVWSRAGGWLEKSTFKRFPEINLQAERRYDLVKRIRIGYKAIAPKDTSEQRLQFPEHIYEYYRESHTA